MTYSTTAELPTPSRLGKASHLFGRKEIRHLRNLLYTTENVVELGQGEYGGKHGLFVLTTERLFFFGEEPGQRDRRGVLALLD